ncbi:hypothetical protein [Dyella sp. C9]|uniref:hypothetical protein n=1 Tax=Dyella sp. C9 TaxID=2202154 RepID=UPI001300A587|nr:hypothetical protein [Dyella sp. C9]
MPWPAGLALGLVAFVGIQYGTGWLRESSSNPILSGFAKLVSSGFYTPLARLTLIMFCIAALASFLGRRKRLTQRKRDSSMGRR